MLRMMRKGQSTAEYAIVIGLVIAAVVAMQVYVKRGLQGKIKDATVYKATDDTVTGATGQYEPYYAGSTLISSRTATDTEAVSGSTVTRSASDTSTRTGTQTVSAASNDGAAVGGGAAPSGGSDGGG